MVPIMFITGKNPGINQKTIADRLILDQSTMSRDIKKLEQKGWLTIQRGTDSRNTALFVTPEGYKVLEKVAPVWQKMHEQTSALLGTFSIQFIDQITSAIQQMSLDKEN